MQRDKDTATKTLGLVSRNLTDLVSPAKAQTRKMRTLDVGQAQAFLARADQSMYGPIWIVALATGMRRGELLGVRWKDIDFDRHEFHVRQTVGSLGGRIEFKPPKTRGSIGCTSRQSLGTSPITLCATPCGCTW